LAPNQEWILTYCHPPAGLEEGVQALRVQLERRDHGAKAVGRRGDAFAAEQVLEPMAAAT
jgi:hypothetical protein